MKTKRNNSLSISLGAAFLIMSYSLAFSQQSGNTEFLSNEVALTSEYVRITSLPDGNRQLASSEAPAKMRAALTRFHLALQLVKNSNFAPNQVDAILDSIGLISDEYYDHPSRSETTGQKKLLVSF